MGSAVSPLVKRMMNPLESNYRFNQVVGTGGIGSGIVMVVEGNETLRRNESRFGRLLPSRDYCKLHIVFHYIASLLAASDQQSQPSAGVQVLPIGRIGADHDGNRLRLLMGDVGMNVDGVTIDTEQPTMFSVCIQYEDKSGGNVTTSTSASSRVSFGDVEAVLIKHQALQGRELVVALPEVPLETRIHILQLGRTRHSFNVASVASSEVSRFREMGGIGCTDLMALNIDEAAALIGLTDDDWVTAGVVRRCIDALTDINPDIDILITDGSSGSYGYHKGRLEYVPPLQTDVVQTGGAGDAYLAGVVIGLCCGLPFLKEATDTYFGETPLTSCCELGTLLASLSLTTADSLYESLDLETVLQYGSRFLFSEAWQTVFGR